MKSQFLSHSQKETKDFAKNLARQILLKRSPRKNALVLGLQGELGAGKTSFAQGFAKGLSIKEKVLSPTFVIMKSYKIPDTRYNIQRFYHIDCYRLQKPKELLSLGFQQIVSNPQNIVLIEWADKIKNILPKDAVRIKFTTRSLTTRSLQFIS